jgi:D-xylose transport system ATP-binding protein
MAEMDVERIIAQMVGREMNQLYPVRSHVPGEVIFEARNVTCYDADKPQRKRVDNISFKLRKGEILGIAGLVGAGRTELVSALFGAYPGPSEAEVWLDGVKRRYAHAAEGHPRRLGAGAGRPQAARHRARPGRRPEHHADGAEGFRARHPHRPAGRTRDHPQGDQEWQAEDRQPFLPITSLSGGNQQKAVLSKMLLTKPKMLILDEPTRGVDVGAKFEIYKLMFELAAQGMSIIMVSSELAEVLGISDRVLVVGEGKLRGDFVNDNLTQETVLAAALDQTQPAQARSLIESDLP